MYLDLWLLLLSFLDFNEDDYICENDLKKVISRLCGEQRLSEDNMQALTEKVITILCIVSVFGSTIKYESDNNCTCWNMCHDLLVRTYKSGEKNNVWMNLYIQSYRNICVQLGLFCW